jgi:hypothetical protein
MRRRLVEVAPTGYAAEPIVPASALFCAVLGGFYREQVSYCYWKSTAKLPHVLSGSGDLDLLIARSDQERAHTVLLSHGCKLFPSAGDREPPGVLTYLGFDAPTGRILHFHIHLRLVVGGPLSTVWRLPWEERILELAVPDPDSGIMRLDATCEILLAVVRSCLTE